MTHSLDLVPLGDDGITELACWLDGPPLFVLFGCSCGWRGPALDLSETALATFAGEMSLDKEQFTAVHEGWTAMHAAALVPAVHALTDPIPAAVV